MCVLGGCGFLCEYFMCMVLKGGCSGLGAFGLVGCCGVVSCGVLGVGSGMTCL